MFKILARKLKWGLAVASMATIGSLGIAPANAAVYQGAWDPAFGDAFPELGWRGEAKFFVPDACLNESGWIFFFSSCTSSEEMAIISAEVEFYKLSDPDNAAFQETLTFGMSSDAVVSMRLIDGVLTSVFGTFTYSAPSTLAIAGGPYTDFVLFFEGDIARMAFHSDPPRGKDVYGISDKNPREGGTPFITFNVVPEPGTTGLLIAGLLMIAVAGRRRLEAPHAAA